MLFTVYLLSLPFAAVFVLFYSLYVDVLNSDCPDTQLPIFFSFLNFVEMFLSTLFWPIMLSIIVFMDYIYPYVSVKMSVKYLKIQTCFNKITRYNHLCDTCCHCGYSVRHFTSQGRKVVKTGLGMELCEDCVDKLYYSTFPHRKPTSRKKST